MASQLLTELKLQQVTTIVVQTNKLLRYYLQEPKRMSFSKFTPTIHGGDDLAH